MAEFPALPFFTDAYLADTRHLTTEEHGAYLLLLMCAWRTRGCALPDDNRFLARIAGVTPTRWRRLRPTIASFFDIADGKWTQKKLGEVYSGVQARVAKNRANGAKGGMAKARKAGDRPGEMLPAKAKVQTPEPKPGQGDIPPHWRATVAAAAGLPDRKIPDAVLREWHSAGAVLEGDILPVISLVRARQEEKAGKAPATAAYYTSAILDARDDRLGAVRRGRAHADANPGAAPRRPFDKTSPDDWAAFLGDPASRFRGDYISQNWFIPADHPLFLPQALGPDPRHAVNPDIPEDVHALYARPWQWRTHPRKTTGD